MRSAKHLALVKALASKKMSLALVKELKSSPALLKS
jgi:hypothetical protein